ncbi:MAG: YihY/virulence factor BrkB family protein [Actinomycetota bacterium]|nr:YihY/virulence factor BrkB family protein [Actinomycetota bacterium]
MGLGSLFVTLWTWLRIPAALLIMALILALVYYLFPNTKQPFRLITPGALIAVLVWIAASLGFSFYVRNFGSYSATYGALATVIVLLFYFYISAAVLLLGAEVNAEVYREVAEGEDEDGGGGRSRRAERLLVEEPMPRSTARPVSERGPLSVVW